MSEQIEIEKITNQLQTIPVVKHSITRKVLTITFVFYFCFTFITTVTHMFFEYKHFEDKTKRELQVFTQSIEIGLADGIWNLDENQIYSILEGALKPRFVVGIRTNDSESTWRLGVTDDPKAGKTFYTNPKTRNTIIQESQVGSLLSYDKKLIRKKNNATIGSLTLYSSSNVVFDEVKYGFILLIINAVLKTLALWAFFLTIGHYYLSTPLTALIRSIENFTQHKRSLEKVEFDLNSKNTTEVDVLNYTFNEMIEDLDTTQRKMHDSNIKLFSTQLRLTGIIDAMPSAIIGIDEEGTITDWNTQTEKLTQVTTADALGNKVENIYPNFNRYIEMAQESIKTLQPQHRHRHLSLINKTTRYFDIITYPVVHEHYKGSVIRIDDVTDDVHNEHKKIHSDKMSSIGTLSSAIARQVLDPLGVIVQGIQNIQRRIDINLASNQKKAEELGLNLQTMFDYLSDRHVMSFLSKMQESSQEVSERLTHLAEHATHTQQKETVSIQEIIRSIIHSLEEDTTMVDYIDFEKVKIDHHIDPDIPNIDCIPFEIKQAIIEIIKNCSDSFKDLNNGYIDIHAHSDARFVHIDIKDNGAGMEQDVLEKAMNPFYTTKTKDNHMGMGLSIAHQCVERHHNGYLKVSSEPGNGTRVRISLPITT